MQKETKGSVTAGKSSSSTEKRVNCKLKIAANGFYFFSASSTLFSPYCSHLHCQKDFCLFLLILFSHYFKGKVLFFLTFGPYFLHMVKKQTYIKHLSSLLQSTRAYWATDQA